MELHSHIKNDPPRKFKHFRCGVRLSNAVLVLVAMLAAASCKEAQPKENVQPPQPGTPAAAKDVQGIYRSVHQGVLQLRGNGSFVLIVPEGPGPTGGTFTLANGTLSVRTDACGAAVGTYKVTVTGPPRAGVAAMHFTVVSDDCGPRSRYLTVDPWVYANS